MRLYFLNYVFYNTIFIKLLYSHITFLYFLNGTWISWVHNLKQIECSSRENVNPNRGSYLQKLIKQWRKFQWIVILTKLSVLKHTISTQCTVSYNKSVASSIKQRTLKIQLGHICIPDPCCTMYTKCTEYIKTHQFYKEQGNRLIIYEKTSDCSISWV